MKRESFKYVNCAGKKWKIGKMDALTGSYMATKLLGKVGEMAIAIIGGDLMNEMMIMTVIAREIGSFSKAEFLELQRDCLSVISEVTVREGKEFAVPIALPDGRWASGELQDDPLTVMALTVHAAVFNMLPFFDGDRLKEVKDGFQGLFPSMPKT